MDDPFFALTFLHIYVVVKNEENSVQKLNHLIETNDLLGDLYLLYGHI